jgi:hypothetical protein
MTDDGRARAARLLARSRYAMPRADAITHIEERRKTLLAPAAPPPAALETDFAVNRRGTLTPDRRAILTPPVCASSAAQGRSCGA